MTISKVEWDALKKRCGNKCLMCGTPDRGGKLLEKAHLKARSKGGTQYVPLCPTCHTNFDNGLATDAELNKLGLSRSDYGRVQPKKSGSKKESASGTSSPFSMNIVSAPPIGSPFVSPKASKSKSKKNDDNPFFSNFDLFGSKSASKTSKSKPKKKDDNPYFFDLLK